MNEPKRMTILLLSDDYRKAVTAFRLAVVAVSKGMNVTMFFTSCGLKAVSRNKKLWLPGVLMPFTWIAIRQMEKAGIDNMEALRESAREFGVGFYACKSCATSLRMKEDVFVKGVELVETGKYIELLDHSDIHLEIC
jgi:peroxiredoxin family protein